MVQGDDNVVKVYRFKAGDINHCAAPSGAVIATFGNIANFKTIFGGGVIFGPSSSPEFLGVWGSRNASRLHRLLKEALGPVEIMNLEPPARKTFASINGSRLTRAERDAMMKRIRTQSACTEAKRLSSGYVDEH